MTKKTQLNRSLSTKTKKIQPNKQIKKQQMKTKIEENRRKQIKKNISFTGKKHLKKQLTKKKVSVNWKPSKMNIITANYSNNTIDVQAFLRTDKNRKPILKKKSLKKPSVRQDQKANQRNRKTSIKPQKKVKNQQKVYLKGKSVKKKKLDKTLNSKTEIQTPQYSKTKKNKRESSGLDLSKRKKIQMIKKIILKKRQKEVKITESKLEQILPSKIQLMEDYQETNIITDQIKDQENFEGAEQFFQPKFQNVDKKDEIVQQIITPKRKYQKRKIFFLVNVEKGKKQWIFSVQGPKNSIYYVTISKKYRCICADYKLDNNICQHIKYVIHSVYKCKQVQALNNRLFKSISSIQTQETKYLTDSNQKNECKVCYHPLKQSQMKIQCSPCAKQYHRFCINSWRRYHKTKEGCPMCSQKIGGSRTILRQKVQC